MNYFELFEISENIKIDQALLSAKFYELQRKFHPDKFIQLPLLEQQKKLKESIVINKAYHVLKNFFLRAKYILSLHGFDLLNKNDLIQDKNFLIEQFHLSEKLQNINKKSKNFSEIKKLRLHIKNCIKKHQDEIIFALNKKEWKTAIDILKKISFFLKKDIFLKNISIEYNI
ncbi:Fe-S protein assembly co-chaperone HscB [Buchnera aphidicola]|uniref:Fe-S protein assembly co-chaperone HscB n=1 Tax=Buchnera aphidicola TaxID=9 RepID=UPI003463DF7A